MTFAQLRGTARTWFLKYELQRACPTLAEVATLGGMDQAIQVLLDPQKRMAYG